MERLKNLNASKYLEIDINRDRDDCINPCREMNSNEFNLSLIK